MAVVIRGSTTCRISGRIIDEGDEIVAFPAFVYNEADPLFFFSDSVFLKEAFLDHPLSSAAQARYEEHRSRTGPGNRICAITGKEIVDPTDHLELGYLTEDPSDPLYRFNYMQLSRSALRDWSDLPHLLRLLEGLNASGKWKGTYVEELISELRGYTASSEA